VTLPVVWIPEANEDLLEARAWYDNIRPELGERFALAIEATVEALVEHPLQFPVGYRSRRRAGVRREWDCVPPIFKNHNNNGKIVISLCNYSLLQSQRHEAKWLLTKPTAARKAGL
jgi:plasmid stabilization system protein ParE